MTFDGAKHWLAKIGGRATIERGTDHDAVVVRVTSAKGAELSRYALFPLRPGAYRREMAYRDAFVEACEALRRALD